MEILIVIFILIFGLCVGSFINALIYRLKTGKGIVKERSMCPKCGHVLAWYDLAPVISWLILRAKCRYCKKKISWEYPVVEVITGVLFVLVYLKIQELGNQELFNCSVVQLLMYLMFTAILIIIFIYDLKYYLILDKVSIPAMIIVILLQVFKINYDQLPIVNYQLLIFSAIIGGGFFLIQYLISRGKWIGGGDIRLGILMGLMLSWPKILVALFLSYILGSIVCLPLVFLKKKRISSEVPFGTFLTVGTFITLLWGSKLLDWYLGLL